jgi:hypothetical protein
MLTEAQIEIVDDSGQVEDRVRIVGNGEVALATKGTSRFQLTSDDPADVDAIIRLRDGAVTVEARKHQALRVDDAFLPMEKPRDVHQQLRALVVAVRRHLHVTTAVVPTSSLMGSGGVVIRDQPSELARQAAAAAAKGVARMNAHLDRLRARGAIDDRGRLLVPFPEDMNPESKTDV